MYVRWQLYRPQARDRRLREHNDKRARLKAILVESVRVDGKPVQKHIARCEAGDMQAIKDLADRLDGRPAQMVEDSRPDSEPITRIVHEIVHVTETPEEIAAEGEEPLLIERRGVVMKMEAADPILKIKTAPVFGRPRDPGK